MIITLSLLSISSFPHRICLRSPAGRKWQKEAEIAISWDVAWSSQDFKPKSVPSLVARFKSPWSSPGDPRPLSASAAWHTELRKTLKAMTRSNVSPCHWVFSARWGRRRLHVEGYWLKTGKISCQRRCGADGLCRRLSPGRGPAAGDQGPWRHDDTIIPDIPGSWLETIV